MDGTRYVPLDRRGILSVEGPDARSFLQGIISNDMGRVSSERAIYAGLLSPQGKFLHDFMVVAEEAAFLLDCERERAADLVRRLQLYRLRAKAVIRDLSAERVVVAVVGGDPAAAVGIGAERGDAGRFAGGVAFVDPRLPVLGVRAILPADGAAEALAAAGLQPADPFEYERLRLALGVPDGSRDIVVDRAFLLESNFEELQGVDFAKGCYVGQENTSRQKYRGTVRKRLLPVAVDGPLPEPGTPILRGGTEVGTIRSGLDGRAIALLRLEHLETRSDDPFRAGEATVTPIRPDWMP